MIESHNMRLIFIFVIGITQIFTLPQPQGYEFGSPLSFEETHVDETSFNDSPMEVNNIEEIHADAVMEEQNHPSLSSGIWSSPIEVDDMSSLHADAVMEAKKRKGSKGGFGKRIFDSPVELDDLDNLHADAVMDAKKKESPGKKWFEAIDAKTLDKVITEMNEMNRWFAKVVKYWDDFTSGGTGEEVLKETGMGIEEPDAVDAGNNEEKTTPEEEGVDETADGGDEGEGEEYPVEDIDEEAPPEEDVGNEAPTDDEDVDEELPADDEDVDEELPAEEEMAGEGEEPLEPLDETQPAEGEEELPAEEGDLPEEEAPTEEELPEEAEEEEATESSRRRRMRRRRRM